MCIRDRRRGVNPAAHSGNAGRSSRGRLLVFLVRLLGGAWALADHGRAGTAPAGRGGAWPGLLLVIASVHPLPAQSSMTARDQHQPASSRALATLAITGSFLRSLKCSHRWCSLWLPACPRARAAAGASSHLALIVAPGCLLYTSPSPRDRTRSRMPS